MVRAVRWAQSALDDFDSAVAHLRERDPAAAERMVSEIDRAATGLGRRNTGRFGRVPGTFEKSVPKWRYIIAFQILPDAQGVEEIVIVHVIHTARHWPKGEWPA